MKKQPVMKDDSEGWRYFAADFETTTAAYSTEETHVWSFAYDEVGKYDPKIYGSIDDFFRFCTDPALGIRKRVYFHNLKFDGNFILWYLLNVLHFETRINPETGEMERPKNLINNECVYIIADTGQWYYIAFKIRNILVEVRDSLKIMPFTLKQIGNAFCKKYKKTEMEYDDKQDLSDCSEEDIEYIKNDVLVLSEALSFLMQTNNEESPFKPIHSLTIGGACLQEFKEKNYGDNKSIMIHLDDMSAPEGSGYISADEYIRQAYRGGYCYVRKGLEGVTLDEEGFTADVNSLYPFAMCTEYSGSVYPFGKGKFYKGKPLDKYVENDSYYFYMRVNVAFRLRSGFVPTIQKKNSFFYQHNTYLESSAPMDFRTGRYIGKPQLTEFTFSKDDWILFCRHYEILKIEYLDYILFMTADRLFDNYIKEFAKIKQESKGAVRSLAKLFSNNLYGQMSKSDNSSYKVVSTDAIDELKFDFVESHSKKVVNIAIGAAITAKARYYQINTIQNNLDRFCYSDTDSLHCTGRKEDFIGKIDDKIYGAYKIEAEWIKAKYVRQKTYIEIFKDGFMNICAAGMTPEQKDRFRKEKDFEDFKIGLTIKGGKLKPKSVRGGVILEEVDFTIH